MATGFFDCHTHLIPADRMGGPMLWVMGSLDEILEQFRSVGIDDSLREHLMVTSTKAYFDRYGRPRA